MRKEIILMLVFSLVCCTAYAQSGKREKKRNLVVKEWNARSGTATPSLDHVTTYDSLGRKVEETEYASYGQKSRVVYEYSGKSTKVSREVVYNDKNKVSRIKKFEYDAEGRKAKQYNYSPKGKLETTKTFEYSYK